MTITSPSGRTYTWDKDTPPTADDIAALQAYEAKLPKPDAAPAPPSRPVNPDAKLGVRGYMDMAAAATNTPIASPQGLATAARMGGAMLSTEGGPLGSAINGGGEKLGQIIEGSNDGGQLASAMTLGVVPGGADAGFIKGVVAPMAKNALGSAVATNAESLVNTGQPASMGDTMLSAGRGALTVPAGLAAGRIAQKVVGIKGTLLSPQDALMEQRDSAFRALRGEGVVIPPHEIGRGSDIISSTGGKAALQQQAAIKNQAPWNALSREDLGLSKKALPIMPGDFNRVRTNAYEPYEAIKDISKKATDKLEEMKNAAHKPGGYMEREIAKADPTTNALMSPLITQAAADVDALKIARYKAQSAYDAFKAGNPAAYDQWQSFKNEAESLDGKIRAAAESVGDPKLVERLDASRKIIAKSYSIQRATNPSTGLVDPAELGNQIWNQEPVSGNAKKIGDFHNAFYREAREAGAIPAPGVSNLNAQMGMGMASRGNTSGIIGGLANATVGRPVRAALLSELSQNRLAQPNFMSPQNDLGDKFSQFLLRYGKKPNLDAAPLLYNNGR